MTGDEAGVRVMAEAGDKVADRYPLQEPIGRGGMGVVWRAHDELLDRQVAVKCARPDDDRAVARLTNEARNAARLHHHRRLAVVIDRQVLRHLLLTGLTVRTGAALTGYDVLDDGKVEARFAHGDPATADLLVGADGIGSAVRAVLSPRTSATD
ncbi:hypothetical protein AB0D24_22910 [Streptomyces javensis]|uniref:hypothetical protein n=1 Tax=Streptomyces javensis TaxID=114698 RepID=UPI0033C626D7